MSLPYLVIDGYNVILRPSGVKPGTALWQARRDLINKLISFSAKRQMQVVIIFDGQNEKISIKESFSPQVQVLFSHPPEKADEYIKRWIQSHPPMKNITVVTSDNAIAQFARSCSCSLWPVEVLKKRLNALSQISYDEKFGSALSASEIEEWMKLFGMDDDSD
jgi:uncharacterized protein